VILQRIKDLQAAMEKGIVDLETMLWVGLWLN
jgi:hypothetical protein